MRCGRETVLLLTKNALDYSPTALELTSFIPNVRGVPDTKSRKITPREAEIRRRRYVALQLNYPYLWADPNHTSQCVPKLRRVPCVNFQETYSNKTQDTAEKVSCSSNTVALHYRPILSNHSPFLANVNGFALVKFHGNSCNSFPREGGYVRSSSCTLSLNTVTQRPNVDAV